MLGLISALLIVGSTPVTHEVDPDVVALRVRVHADAHVDDATVRPALAVADELLALADLVVAWRICDRAQSCPVADTSVPEIVVILSSRDPQVGREHCGIALHGARDMAGTVMVSIPCVAGVAFRLSRYAGTGTNPLLAMPRHDDLVGAVVAHEIGHLLGITHASSGLMRASLDSGDIIALRRGKLRFSPSEAREMRIAVVVANSVQRRTAGRLIPRQGLSGPPASR